MRKQQFDVRLDAEDVNELNDQAKKLGITPSALARIFIKNGLTEYSPEKLRLLDLVDLVHALTVSNSKMLLANLFLSSRAQVITFPKNEGESEEAYRARLGAESVRLIKIAMDNTSTIQSHIDGK